MESVSAIHVERSNVCGIGAPSPTTTNFRKSRGAVRGAVIIISGKRVEEEVERLRFTNCGALFAHTTPLKVREGMWGMWF